MSVAMRVLHLTLFVALVGCGGGASSSGIVADGSAFNGNWYPDGHSYGGIAGTGSGGQPPTYMLAISNGSTIVYESTQDGSVLGTSTLVRRFSPFRNSDAWYSVDARGVATAVLDLNSTSGELTLGMEGPDAASSGFMRGHAN